MANSRPYVAVCSVCSVEFPAQCGVNYDIGTANLGQTCPNGHKDYLYLKHESAAQVAQRINIWWSDYHWWKPVRPVSENDLIAGIGFGMLGEFEGMTDDTRRARESYLAQNRDLFHQAMSKLSESGDYHQVEGDGTILLAKSRWIGLKEHWSNLFQEKTAHWTAQIEAAENLHELPNLIDALSRLSEDLGIPFDKGDELRAEVIAARQKQAARIEAEAKTAKSRKTPDSNEAVPHLIVGTAKLAFWVLVAAVLVSVVGIFSETQEKAPVKELSEAESNCFSEAINAFIARSTAETESMLTALNNGQIEQYMATSELRAAQASQENCIRMSMCIEGLTEKARLMYVASCTEDAAKGRAYDMP